VIDDEPDILTFLTTVLEDNEANTMTASDGIAGIEMAKKEQPDLITLDLSMPQMDGGEVFVRLREDSETKHIPIVIVTGKPELRKLIYDKPHRPPEGYLDKPVDEEGFVKSVRKILELAHKEKQVQ